MKREKERSLNNVLRLIKAIIEDIRGICTRPYVIGLSGNLVPWKIWS
jgi:hypothetical protein